MLALRLMARVKDRGTVRRYDGAAPRCHACNGAGDGLAAMRGRDDCHWCDDAGRAKWQCKTCGEPLPGCLCWDLGGVFRVLPRCECGNAGLLFRRGTVVCARCEVEWLVADAKERAQCMAEWQARTEAAQLRTCATELLARQVKAEARDEEYEPLREQARACRERDETELRRRFQRELQEVHGRREAERRVRRTAAAYGVDL